MTAVLHAVYHRGRISIAGCDKHGRQYRVPIDPLMALALAAELERAAERAIAHAPHLDAREPLDLTECDREVERT